MSEGGEVGAMGGDGAREGRDVGAIGGEGDIGGEGGTPTAPLVDRDGTTIATRRPPRRGAHRRPQAGRRSRRRLLVLAVAGICVAVIAASAGYYEWAANAPSGSGTVLVTAGEGATLSSLEGELAADGVIRSSLAFRLYLHLHSVPTLYPGTYRFNRPSSFGSVLSVLARGPIAYQLLVPPGFTLQDVAWRVGRLPGHSEAAFLRLAASGAVRSAYSPPGSASLEGLIAPSTYSIAPGESDRDILAGMVQGFNALASGAGLAPGARGPGGLDAYQVIVVASIVRAEAKLPPDRAKVARVVYNRLAAGMHLDMDSSVSYGLGHAHRAPTAAELQAPGPYNTYLDAGLPPTPIATVDAEDIAAALGPAPGPWLYFVVVQADGAEAFSATYAGQQANIRRAQSRGLAG